MLGWRTLVPSALLVLLASLALARSNDPPAGRTGAPAVGTYSFEPNCTAGGCHVGVPNNGSGEITIRVPAEYLPGEAYEIMVTLASTSTQNRSTRRWGFELVAIRTDTGKSAGVLSSPDLRIVAGIQPFAGRTYISHNRATFKQGEPTPVQWTFTWTAPSEEAGTVAFYASGNAANGSGSSSGDFIYTGTATSFMTGTPVEAASWGAIKRRFGVR